MSARERDAAGDTVLRRYTFKLYPNQAQAAALEHQRALHSALYNALIQQRIEAWSRGQWTMAPTDAPRLKRGRTLTAFGQGYELKALRAELPEYAALSRGSLEQTVKRVDLAFKAFFRRARQGAGAASGFPRYKRVDGFGMREASHGGWSFHGNRLRIQGVPGTVRARGRFPMPPKRLLTCDLMLRAGDWLLSVVAELPPRLRRDADHSSEVRFDLVDSFARVRRVDGALGAGPEETVFAATEGRISPPASEGYGEAAAVPSQMEGDRRGRAWREGQPDAAAPSQMEGDRREVAPDANLGAAAVPSQMEGDRGVRLCLGNGAAVPSQTEADRGMTTPRTHRCIDTTTQDLQRRMARCKRGSHRYRRLRLLKARHEATAARRRREALHEWTTAIARRNASLSVIAPHSIVAVTASGRGDERDWGAAVATKAALNRAVLDQAPSAAIAMLAYKMAERGGSFAVIGDASHPVTVGLDLVEATKQARRAARRIRKADSSDL